jgi:hypothetical protein
MSEIKTNFIMAVRGYKTVKKQKNANFTDVEAVDDCSNKVLLRIIEPLTNEYIVVNDVRKMAEAVKGENYHSAILISRHFTPNALEEMQKQKIQYISEDYMPPFDIQDLYLAVMNCASSQCQKKCSRVSPVNECSDKAADFCKTKAFAAAAKRHFEDGAVGLLKNDLKMALALTR